MAEPIDFQERNDYIGKPNSMTDNQCVALPVARVLALIPGLSPAHPPERIPGFVHCWKLTDEERVEVAKTGLIYVQSMGMTLTPMKLLGFNPIGETHIVFSEEQIKALHEGKLAFNPTTEKLEII